MTTSSVAQVLDLSIAKILGLLPLDLPNGSSEPFYLVDGSPGPGAKGVANLITVMPLPQDESRGSQEWEDSTKGRIEEYDIQIHIWSYVGGGADPNTLTTAQQQARANATLAEAAIENAFLVDANLSAQLGTGANPITWMLLAGVSYSQTNPEEDDGKGRFSQYDLTYHVYNYLSGPGS